MLMRFRKNDDVENEEEILNFGQNFYPCHTHDTIFVWRGYGYKIYFSQFE